MSSPWLDSAFIEPLGLKGYTVMPRPAESGRAMPITVLVADDKEVVLSSIRLLLGSDPEIRIVGEAANFQQTLQRASELKPQIVVMDLHMPDDSSVSPQEIKSVLNTLGLAADCNVFLE